ncbi:MAG: hypothetical protein AVDCRST_MAG64-3985 [uncultured Phycisphaerae bacterium]|uniref:Uncharacterized protein n=1 Tax=uncultured Phycisphaerae bacterium TaxID=904963 RepID=A0A6J4QII5_9BACT|nr:MAG: hypothetical protein AVDCRST_MAG64-3985 [uncultured Phycisphaerae bacterium]
MEGVDARDALPTVPAPPPYATLLASEPFVTWPEDEEPGREGLVAAAAGQLDALWERLAGVPDALRPTFHGT